MLLPFPKALHFPTPHRIAPTTAHPAVPSPNAQEKDYPPPFLQFFFLLSVIFPTNHQSQAACPHTLGWGATPGSPTVGISLPERWPGRQAPQRRQREKWVCVHSRMQGSRAARPPAHGIWGPVRSLHLAPPAGRCHRR